MYDSWTPKGKEAVVVNEQKRWKEEELNEKVVEEQSNQSLQSTASAREKRKASMAKQKLQPSMDGGPCWKISLYTESLDAENVKIVLDKRYEESFLNKKAAIWDVQDPNRTEVGNKLRQAFINDYVKELLPKSQSREVSVKEVPVVARRSSRKKSSSASRRSTKSGRKAPSVVKVETVSEEPLVMPKLLPPLIDKFSLPLPFDVIPIVIELEPVPTSAPLHLGPFREEIPVVYEEARGEEIFGESFFPMERLPSAEAVKSEVSQKNLQQTQDMEYLNLKQAGDAALEAAYAEREKAIREVMKAQEKEHKATKRRQSRKQSRRQSRRQSRKKSTKKSIRRQSKSPGRRKSTKKE